MNVNETGPVIHWPIPNGIPYSSVHDRAEDGVLLSPERAIILCDGSSGTLNIAFIVHVVNPTTGAVINVVNVPYPDHAGPTGWSIGPFPGGAYRINDNLAGFIYEAVDPDAGQVGFYHGTITTAGVFTATFTPDAHQPVSKSKFSSGWSFYDADAETLSTMYWTQYGITPIHDGSFTAWGFSVNPQTGATSDWSIVANQVPADGDNFRAYYGAMPTVSIAAIGVSIADDGALVIHDTDNSVLISVQPTGGWLGEPMVYQAASLHELVIPVIFNADAGGRFVATVVYDLDTQQISTPVVSAVDADDGVAGLPVDHPSVFTNKLSRLIGPYFDQYWDPALQSAHPNSLLWGAQELRPGAGLTKNIIDFGPGDSQQFQSFQRALFSGLASGALLVFGHQGATSFCQLWHISGEHPALRLNQRDDNLGISPTPRLIVGAGNSPSSEQYSQRIAASNTYT